MSFNQGCNRIVQYSVRPNTIWQIVDIRLGTEYQYSYLVGVTEYQYSYSVGVTEYQYSYSVGVTEYYQYSYSVRAVVPNLGAMDPLVVHGRLQGVHEIWKFVLLSMGGGPQGIHRQWETCNRGPRVKKVENRWVRVTKYYHFVFGWSNRILSVFVFG